MFIDSKGNFELETKAFRLCISFSVKTWTIHSLHSFAKYGNVNTITEPRNEKGLKPRNPINKKWK